MKYNCYMLDAEDVSKILKISKSKSYVLIRACNKELEAGGFYVIPGKVPKAFFEEKIYGLSSAAYEET